MQTKHGHLKAWLAVGALAAIGLFLVLRDSPGPANPFWTGQTMGTTYSIRLAGSPLSMRELRALQLELDRELVRINEHMSHYNPGSELSRFNQHLSTEPFEVSQPLSEVTRFALEVSARSKGAFDPTLGPLVNLWGFGPTGRRVMPPTDEEIDAVRTQYGYHHLHVSNNSLIKDIPELQLNLSAVAKGYGVDAAAAFLVSRGLTNVFVEIGGEVAAAGVNEYGGPWRVGIDTPDADRMPGEQIQAIVELSGRAVATSGDYRNFFIDESGRRFSHILDPRTGRPVQHNLAAVSVIADNAMTADALATALFVMGVEEGMPWIESWPRADALFIVRNEDGSFSQHASSGFVTTR